MEFIVRRQQRARREHSCTLCRFKIQPGAEYILEKYRDDDGKVQTVKLHIRCDMLKTEYVHSGEPDEPDTWREDDVRQWLMDTMCGSCIENCMTGFTPTACGRVLDKLIPEKYKTHPDVIGLIRAAKGWDDAEDV